MPHAPEAAGVPSRPSGVRAPRVLVFLSALGTSLLADQAVGIALLWSATQISTSSVQVSVVVAAYALPRAIWMLMGGALADRVGAARAMVMGEALTASFLVVGAVSMFLHGPTIAGLGVLAILLGTSSAILSPATSSLLPQLVARAEISQVNGVRQLLVRGALLVGAPLGGVAIATVSLPAVLLTASVLYLYSTAVAVGLRRLTLDGAKERPARASILRQVGEGLRYARRSGPIAALLGVNVVVDFLFAGPVNVGVALWVSAYLLQPTALGFLMGSLGVGAIVGALSLARYGNRLLRPRMTIALLGLQGGCIATLAMHRSVLLGALAMATAGVVMGIAGGAMVSLVQLNTDKEYLGRMMSILGLSGIGLAPLSLWLFGVVADAAGLVAALLLFGGCQLVACLGIARLRAIHAVETAVMASSA